MKKILLIEDNQEVAENVAAILIISGYIVDIASNSDKRTTISFSLQS